MPSEECVMPVVDDINVASGGIQDRLQPGQADAEHGIQHDPRPAPPDRLDVDLRHDGIQVVIPGIDKLDPAILQCLLKGHVLDFFRIQGVGLRGNPVGKGNIRVPSAPGEQLDSVVHRRIVAGRDHRAVGQIQLPDRKHHQGCGAGQIHEPDKNALPRHHF